MVSKHFSDINGKQSSKSCHTIVSKLVKYLFHYQLPHSSHVYLSFSELDLPVEIKGLSQQFNTKVQSI